MVASQQINEKYGCFATKVMKSMVAAQQSVCETNKQSVDVSFFHLSVNKMSKSKNHCVMSCNNTSLLLANL
jgi:hypothetical protein